MSKKQCKEFSLLDVRRVDITVSKSLAEGISIGDELMVFGRSWELDGFHSNPDGKTVNLSLGFSFKVDG